MSTQPVPSTMSDLGRPASGQRIRRRSEFRRVLEDGNRLPQRRVVVYVRPSGPATRAGFVCVRHVGGAVVRNRARRLLREAWQGVAPLVTAGYDIVFVARPQIREAKTRELMEEMTRALAAAGVIAE
ncbi:MAG: ribonuclease P protein component [Actinomycetota bacterium]